ncbi:anthrax toxin-like adenylyl cyclase domain-containing protein [Spongorhabdus nitratireducens]
MLKQRSLMAMGHWESRFQRDCLMGIDAVAEDADQGIPRSYIEKIQLVAEKLDVIIAIRPVARICRTLILELYASKPLLIKAKSADWGPQAGFLPVDQALSKNAGLPEKVEHYNLKALECIAQKWAVAQQLVLSTDRLTELEELGILEIIHCIETIPGHTHAASFESTLCKKDLLDTGEYQERKVTRSFEAHQRHDKRWDIYVITDAGREPLKVLADKKYGPMTADFDLLFVDAPYHKVDLGQQDKQHGFHDELGIYSKRMVRVADEINRILDRGPGKNMVHHGADSANPHSDMKDNLPATIWLPKKRMGLYESPLLIKTAEELGCFMLTMQKMGYYTDYNPQWKELEEVATKVIRERIDFFEQKGKP